MAYNPNDCVELRWGAREGTPELATCKRRAPADQRARMEQYRSWFRDARRPPRCDAVGALSQRYESSAS